MATKTDPLVHMGTITGGEARELLKSNPVILLPMGSHEDQGPHAPMGDYLLAEKIAELAALQASKAGTRISGLVAFKKLHDDNALLEETIPEFYRRRPGR